MTVEMTSRALGASLLAASAGLLLLGLAGCETTEAFLCPTVYQDRQSWTMSTDGFDGLELSVSRWVRTSEGAYYVGASTQWEYDGPKLDIYMKQAEAWPPKRQWQIGEEVVVRLERGGELWRAVSGTIAFEPYERSAGEDRVEAGVRLSMKLGLEDATGGVQSFDGWVEHSMRIACRDGAAPSAQEVFEGAEPADAEDAELCQDLWACMDLFNDGFAGSCSY